MRFSQLTFPAVAFALLPAVAWAGLPAFPGAVGQGAATKGGRGGDVYHVTTLEDYNSDEAGAKIEGSLRHALRSATGPRTIVFDVSGPIALKCPLAIRKNHLTIAGQTSPGGVTLWGYPVEISKCSDVVVRHLRVRLGDFHAKRDVKGEPDDSGTKSYSTGNNDLVASSANAMAIFGGAERILLDHLSVSWGMDETLSVTKCRDVTVQNTLISESLNQSFHAKGDHGYGSLVRGELTAEDRAANVGGFTFYRDLWTHHDARNPSLAGQQKLARGQREEDRRSADVNLVNCVIYNWGSQATNRSNDGMVRVNLLGNYYLNGSAKNAKYFFRGTSTGPTFVRHWGNIHDRSVNAQQEGEIVDDADEVARGFWDMNPDDEVLPADPPFAFIGDLAERAVAADEAFEGVVHSVGASLWRDSVDARVIDSVREGTGSLIDSQEKFRKDGRLPGIDDLQIERRPAGFDTDQDGMPDAFEKQHRLNPEDPFDRNGTQLSEEGYTNLEVYLNELAEGKEPS